MELEIQQSRFLSALTLAQSVADRRSTMPVLANALLRATGDGRLTVCATDMMLSLTDVIAATVKKKGAVTVGVRHLLGVVKTLPEGPVQLKGLDNHWLQIVAGRSEFRLMGMADSDFPALPNPADAQFVTIPAHRLADLVQHTIFSVSSDEARVNLNGALFESNGKEASMVSTDGHRLTRMTVPFEGPKLKDGVIIPRKGLLELKRVLDRGGECGIAFADQHLFARSESLELAIKLSAVTFPPYAAVIPKEQRRRATLNRMEFVHALRQAEVMAPEKTATVRLQLSDGTLALTADNPDLGVAHQEISATFQGEPLTAGFNARYLLDALDVLHTDAVHLDFQGELDPCVLRPVEGPDFLAVVMPMRI